MAVGEHVAGRSQLQAAGNQADPPPSRALPAFRGVSCDPQDATRSAPDRQLLERYHTHGDRAARDQLVARLLPLARQLARRYQRPGEPLDDLLQVASLGLLKAIERFDPARPTPFTSFAVPSILGELKRYFRDTRWSLHVPRDLQELTLKVHRVDDKMARELGRAPTAAELGKRIGVSPEQVLEARMAAGAYRALSLDRPRDEENADGGAHAEKFGAEDPGFRQAEHTATLESLVTVLTQRERDVLRLRFQDDLSQSQIAARIGVSQMHVSRIIRSAIARLQAKAQADAAPHSA